MAVKQKQNTKKSSAQKYPQTEVNFFFFFFETKLQELAAWARAASRAPSPPPEEVPKAEPSPPGGQPPLPKPKPEFWAPSC